MKAPLAMKLTRQNINEETLSTTRHVEYKLFFDIPGATSLFVAANCGVQMSSVRRTVSPSCSATWTPSLYVPHRRFTRGKRTERRRRHLRHRREVPGLRIVVSTWMVIHSQKKEVMRRRSLFNERVVTSSTVTKSTSMSSVVAGCLLRMR